MNGYQVFSVKTCVNVSHTTGTKWYTLTMAVTYDDIYDDWIEVIKIIFKNIIIAC